MIFKYSKLRSLHSNRKLSKNVKQKQGKMHYVFKITFLCLSSQLLRKHQQQQKKNFFFDKVRNLKTKLSFSFACLSFFFLPFCPVSGKLSSVIILSHRSIHNCSLNVICSLRFFFQTEKKFSFTKK